MGRMLVAGNWKMHGSRASVAQLLDGLLTHCANFSNVDVAVFPPYVFLDQTSQTLGDSTIQWGAQTLNTQPEGAFTGEISGPMLKEFNCEWVLVGHSERRQYYDETNEIVAEKFQAAQQNGLKPILCVGETKQQREAQQTMDVIAAQLQAVVDLTGVQSLANAVVAYEPVWAIGTGLTASPEQAQEVHHFIRQQIAQLDQSIADGLQILYGGSVKADNAAGLFCQQDIDGALVGGAALKIDQFSQICQQAEG